MRSWPAASRSTLPQSWRSRNPAARSAAPIPFGHWLCISGPYAKEIGMNCGCGMLGPGSIPNSTIGRSLRDNRPQPGRGHPGREPDDQHRQPVRRQPLLRRKRRGLTAGVERPERGTRLPERRKHDHGRLPRQRRYQGSSVFARRLPGSAEERPRRNGQESWESKV